MMHSRNANNLKQTSNSPSDLLADVKEAPSSNRPRDPIVDAKEAGKVVEPGSRVLHRAERQKTANARGPPPDSEDGADALSIARFCQRHGLSPSFYFKLRALGLGPTEMRIGARVLISKEAAAAWRAAREAAATT